MYRLKNITALALGLCLIFNLYFCKSSSSDKKQSEVKNVTVTETFEAKFTGSCTYMGPDTLVPPRCTDTLPFRVIVDAEGTSNIMGDMKGHFDFCSNEQGYYGNANSYLVGQNNDTLFFSSEGKVIEGRTEEHPSFVTGYWKDDTIEIIGGTGKFEGATGKCKTDDYSSSEDPYSHHHWKGTITLIKERE
jgi:hypothetical protein